MKSILSLLLLAGSAANILNRSKPNPPSRYRDNTNNWRKGQQTIAAKQRRLFLNQGPSQHSIDRIARRQQRA